MSDPFMDVIMFLSEKYTYFEFIPAVIGAILNIFHLIILTRKSMRTSSINTVMIGISICDLLNMLFLIYKDLTVMLSSEYECTNSTTQIKLITMLIAMAIKEVSTRLSSWLGLFLASIRLLIVKSSVNPKFNQVSKPIFGLKISLIALLLSFLISLLYFGRVRLVDFGAPWIPGAHCKDFPANYTERQYQPAFVNIFMVDAETAFQIYYISDGVIKTVSTILLPILTIFLILELKVASQKISMTELRNPSAPSNRTTRLVILMTITFIIADGPIGIITLIQGILIRQNLLEHLTIISMLMSILTILVTFNSSIHFIICITVSSPYRETVKSLFSWQKQEPNTLFKTSRVSGSGVSGAIGPRRNSNG